MKQLLTEADRRAVRAALWADIKQLDAPRKVRLLYLEQLFLEWLARKQAENAKQAD